MPRLETALSLEWNTYIITFSFVVSFIDCTHFQGNLGQEFLCPPSLVRLFHTFVVQLGSLVSLHSFLGYLYLLNDFIFIICSLTLCGF